MTLREALDALHRAGRIRSPWLPGMLVEIAAGDRLRAAGDGWSWPSGAWSPGWLVGRDAVPVVDDPATIGCLAAFAREASGCPLAYAEGDWRAGPRCWAVCWWAPGGVLAPEHAFGDTEGEAWAAALIAMAEALP